MMGESSDAEMEECTNDNEPQDIKPDISQQGIKSHITNEPSTDEETEDLHLVLSPEDESDKSSLNDSLTLALSSSDTETVDSALGSEILEADTSMSVEGSTDLLLDENSTSDSDTEAIILQREIRVSRRRQHIMEAVRNQAVSSEADTILLDSDVNMSDVHSSPIAGKSLPILTDNDAESIPDDEQIISGQTSSTKDKDWSEPSSEPELLENIKQENNENIGSTVPVSEDCSLPSINRAHSDSSVSKLESLKVERENEIESGDKALEELPEACCTSTMQQQDSKLFVEYELKVKSEAHNIQNILVKTIKSSVLDEVMTCEKMGLSADQSGIEVKTVYTGGSKVASPVKDIPNAVGLLPLRTALEKLQVMPEHLPRKTRSASSTKESCEAPIVHLKRKTLPTFEGVEKKRKISGADQADTSSDGGLMLASIQELGNANTSLESVPVDEVNKLIIMSEEPLESDKDRGFVTFSNGLG